MGEITRKPLTLQLTDQLREDILLGRIPSGEKISVQALVDRYETSAIPVRESLRTLAGENLVVMHPYQGAYIRKIDRNFFINLYDILRSMEVLMVEGIDGHWNEEIREKLIQANEGIQRIESIQEEMTMFCRYNRAFHNPIEQFCTNERAIELRNYYFNAVMTFRNLINVPHSMERIHAIVSEHQLIIDALDSGDMNRIREAYMLHSLNARKEFLTQLTTVFDE